MHPDSSTIKVFVADHQDIFLDGLKHFAGSLPNIEIAGYCRSDQDLVQNIAQCKPNLVMLDANLPHMHLPSLVQSIRNLDDAILIFVLYSHYSEEILLSILSAGVNGIATKYISKRELETAIFQLLNLQQFYCSFTAAYLQQLIQNNRFHPHMKTLIPVFSDKEKMILQLLSAGLTSKEIAVQLDMSTRTVESYRKSMQEKTGSKNSAGLILYAIKNGMIPVEKC